MKLSEKWLREISQCHLPLATVLELLTQAGLEVESVEPAGCPSPLVVVAQIESFVPHSDAKRLNVCQVTDGTNRYQIVCGASNVKAGMKAALAKVGAVLSPNITISEAKLRGVLSQGMLCSKEELGMAEKSEDILELPADAPLGERLVNYLNLDDHSIEINVTPNRSDCLSVLGIARELQAATQQPFKPFFLEKDYFLLGKEVALFDPPHSQAVPVYYACFVESIDQTVGLPIEIQERLRLSGLRSIHPIVDLANYVMLELGQPLHAFDADKIKLPLHIKPAGASLNFKGLDEKTRTLSPEDTVIFDQSRAVALGGIIGSFDSAVDEKTSRIVIESAHFMPQKIAQTMRRLGISTDAGFRFERGVDPFLPKKAIERMAKLLETHLKAKIVSFQAFDEGEKTYPPLSIGLPVKKVKEILGVEIPSQTIEQSLQGLGMQVAAEKEGWKITPPSWRFDIRIFHDLVEEIARMYGYNQIQQPSIQKLWIVSQGLREEHEDTWMAHMKARGFFQVVNYSFIDAPLAEWFGTENYTLINPLSSEQSVMRKSLIPGLLKVASYNLKRQNSHFKLWEWGVSFHREGKQIREEEALAALMLGDFFPPQWGEPSRPCDFYDVKHELELLLSNSGITQVEYLPASSHRAFHPGKLAWVQHEGKTVGILGELHPELIAFLDLKAPVLAFEIQTAALKENRFLEKAAPREISKFPSVSRDLAFVLDKNIPYAKIEQVIKKSGSQLLHQIELFDIYQGQQIPSHQKSMAVRLTFQSNDQTLIEEIIEKSFQQVASLLEKELGASLRT